MKSVIFDVITGIAIIMALFVVTLVMKANQNFIMESGKSKTNEEQMYFDEENSEDLTESECTMSDVYGVFRSMVKADGTIRDNSIFEVKFTLSDTHKRISSLDVNQEVQIQYMEEYFNLYRDSNPDARFTVEKMVEIIGGKKVHRYRYTVK